MIEYKLVSPKNKRILYLGEIGFPLSMVCKDKQELKSFCYAYSFLFVEDLANLPVQMVNLGLVEEAQLEHADIYIETPELVQGEVWKTPDAILSGEHFPWKGIYNWVEVYESDGIFICTNETPNLSSLWRHTLLEAKSLTLRAGWVMDTLYGVDPHDPRGYAEHSRGPEYVIVSEDWH